MNDSEKILLLPMVKMDFGEKDELAHVIHLVLSAVDLQGCSIKDVSACIIENCIE